MPCPLDNGRFTVAAGACGLIEASLEASLKYCHERKTFGKEIGRHQLVQQMIAKMSANLEISRLLVYRAGWLKNQGKPSTKETSLAKWIACDAHSKRPTTLYKSMGLTDTPMNIGRTLFTKCKSAGYL